MKAPGVGAAVVAALLAAVPAVAQPRYTDPLTLVGPGSAIGARVREVTDEEAKKARLEAAAGVVVTDVDMGAPADRAGLKAGDIVVEFDGEHVRSVRTFQRLVSETPPGRTVKAIVVRDGARKTLDVTPVNSERLAMNRPWLPAPPTPLPPLDRDNPQYRFRAEPYILPNPFGAEPFDQLPVPLPQHPRLGISVAPLSSQMAEMLGVSSGVPVMAVERDSPASRAGVKAGDVITAVDGHAVREPADVTKAVKDATGTIELTIVRDKKEMKLRVTPAPL